MKPREITIIPVLNGFVCRVDCQTVVFKDKNTMLTALSDYYENPKAIEDSFLNNAINKTLNQVPVDCSAPVNIDREPKRPY